MIPNRSSPSRVSFAASRPGPLRADLKGMAVYEGKGGCRSASDFVSHLISFDSIAPCPKPGHSGRACRAEGNRGIRAVLAGPKGFLRPGKPPEPWPRGAVTRRAVAKRLDPPLNEGYLRGSVFRFHPFKERV